MPRPLPTPTQVNLWLDLVEDGWTKEEIAEMAGVSLRTVQRRVADARERRESGEPGVDQSEIGDDDAVYLELVERVPDHDAGDAGWYSLQDDATSHDGTGCFVHIGTGRGGVPRRNRLGTGRHVDSGQSYKARDDGLKGGKG